MNHALLTGFTNCGKSTVGKILADGLGWRYADLDHIIEDLHAAGHKRATFREICREIGLERFRMLELRAANEARRRVGQSRENHVISLGGGAILFDDTRAALKRIGPVVYLRVPLAKILERMRGRGYPAYADGKADPEAEIERLYAHREPLYAQYANHIVDAASLDPAQAAAKIGRLLEGKEQ